MYTAFFSQFKFLISNWGSDTVRRLLSHEMSIILVSAVWFVYTHTYESSLASHYSAVVVHAPDSTCKQSGVLGMSMLALKLKGVT